ncbi:hypothetical protein [Streptomyces sp. MA15]|uniref:hypothetical protein n=1 Tax=Streptomyces sp. MA15 TaxID=3055061 RepID=UPI0025B0A2AB|nr:hypothetical protein [Streptomyces sp. MA15]MDN3268198.1 hypothetical protein [Streptomyces sp. MA15]
MSRRPRRPPVASPSIRSARPRARAVPQTSASRASSAASASASCGLPSASRHSAAPTRHGDTTDRCAPRDAWRRPHSRKSSSARAGSPDAARSTPRAYRKRWVRQESGAVGGSNPSTSRAASSGRPVSTSAITACVCALVGPDPDDQVVGVRARGSARTAS